MVEETKETNENSIDLIIRLDKTTNGISIIGPIGDKVLAYGMLEFAKDAIFEHHKKLEKESASKIITEPNRIMDFVRKGKR